MRRPADFAATLAAGRRARAGATVVYTAPAAGRDWRAGFIVSKKVGNSVQRHRVTRRLRAIVTGRLPGAAPPPDVVVRALAGAASCSYAELDRAVGRALAKALP
jgi:ribonuclease P protein component